MCEWAFPTSTRPHQKVSGPEHKYDITNLERTPRLRFTGSGALSFSPQVPIISDRPSSLQYGQREIAEAGMGIVTQMPSAQGIGWMIILLKRIKVKGGSKSTNSDH